MKKGLALLLALAFGLLLAACGAKKNSGEATNGGGGAAAQVRQPNKTSVSGAAKSNQANQTTQPAGQPGKPAGGKATKAFLAVFQSGNYHLKFRVRGKNGDTVTELYVRGGQTATIVTSKGASTKRIMREGLSYTIMDETQIVLVSTVPGKQEPERIAEHAGDAFVGGGTATFAGEATPYEEYAATGFRRQYFVRGGQLAGIRTIASEPVADMEVLAFDQTIPTDMFEYPAAYTLMGQ